MSIFSAIGDFFAGLFTAAHAQWDKFWAKAEPQVKEVIFDVFGALGEMTGQVLAIVKKAVIQVQVDPTLVTQDERRNGAFALILEELTSLGLLTRIEGVLITSTASLILTFINAVVASLQQRGEMPPNAGATP